MILAIRTAIFILAASAALGVPYAVTAQSTHDE
jgi:hypothetical protein